MRPVVLKAEVFSALPIEFSASSGLFFIFLILFTDLFVYSRSFSFSCWDWWGYTDKINYGVKKGVQPTFVRSLIKALTGK